MDIAGYLGNPTDGILLYKNVWQNVDSFVDRLEAALHGSSHDRFIWEQATVGDSEIMKDYRDCFVVKVRQADIPMPPDFTNLGLLYSEVVSGVRECIKHYSGIYNIQLQYEEATNFIKYGEGQHFAVHPDSGFSYSCAVSAIGYINDGYVGGEYMMPYKNLKFRPEKGDVIVHPSDFIYSHASLPVKQGIKYSAVTMYDYNDRNHKAHASTPSVSASECGSFGLSSANNQVSGL
jgi:hypothetical protein